MDFQTSLGIISRTAQLWDSRTDPITGRTSPSSLMSSFTDESLYRYLKKLFRDLYERQGFADDGEFDWEILKNQRDQQKMDSTVPAPVVESADRQLENTTGSNQYKLSGVVEESSEVKNETSPEPQQPQSSKRSLFSNIRHSLFGPRK